MINKKMRTIIYIILALLLMACKNESVKEKDALQIQENKTAPKNQRVNPANKFFKELKQAFSFNSTDGIKITGKQGTKIEFPKNSFGNYNGKVNIELVEVYDIATMLKLNLTTETINNKLLESGGMIFIEPTDSIGRVLKPQKKYSVDYTLNKDPRMQLFKTSKRKLSEPSKWELLPNTKKDLKKKKETNNSGWISISIEGDTTFYLEKDMAEETYLFNTQSIGWINCDRFLLNNNKNQHLITQTFNVKGNDENLKYIIVLKNYNALVAGRPLNNGNVEFESLPINEPVYGLAMQLEEDSVKFEIKEFKLSATNNITFSNIKKVGKKEFNKIATKMFAKDIWSRKENSKPRF